MKNDIFVNTLRASAVLFVVGLLFFMSYLVGSAEQETKKTCQILGGQIMDTKIRSVCVLTVYPNSKKGML